MTLNSLIFGILTLTNISYYIYNTPKNYVHTKSISLIFHLYFCTMSSFVYQNEDLIECSFVYFIADSFINTYYNVFKTFNKYHHLFALALIYFNKYLDMELINMTGIQEVSTIVLCIIDMNIISKNTFEILFPITFVFCRLVLYNLMVLEYLQTKSYDVDVINYIVLVLLNVMNIGITIKMRLLQKIWFLFFK